ELVAADTEGTVARAHELGEQRREARQHPVAGQVSMQVVDLLEVVDIEEDERERRQQLRAGRLGQLLQQRAPVRQPCQRVVFGEEARLLELRRDRERLHRVVGENAQRL